MQSVNSINKGSKILIIEIEKLEIYSNEIPNIIFNACIGLTIKSFINDGFCNLSHILVFLYA